MCLKDNTMEYPVLFSSCTSTAIIVASVNLILYLFYQDKIKNYSKILSIYSNELITWIVSTYPHFQHNHWCPAKWDIRRRRNGTRENLSRKVTCPGQVAKKYFCTALP